MNIPGYKIERLIAEGGMAAIYLATQESLNRKVALKILKKFDTSEQSERFINEGMIIESLNHPNIITIHDIGIFEDKHYLSMEYLEGGDLESRILRGVNPNFALELIKTIGHCLEFIHERDIVHRDIKPANILFRKDNTAVLTDFGIAKQLQVDTNLTMDGTAMGSPSYLSPEQARNEQVDGRTDIYSLGVVLYQSLTGSRPYYGNSFIDTVMEHISAPIPTLPSHLSRYQTLLEKMMAKNPDDRFASAREMVAFIEKLGKPNYVEHVSGIITKLVKNNHPSPDDKTEILSINDEGGIQQTDDDNSHKANNNSTHKPLYKKYPIQVIGTVVILLILIVWGVFSISYEPESKSVKSEVAHASQLKLEKNNKKINEYLKKAEIAINEDRLTVPKDDNAFSYYKRVLKLQPKNKNALNGLSVIANRYADLAEWQILKYNYPKAKRYVYKGLDVQPDNKRLILLQKRTESAVKDASGRVLNKLKSAFD